MKENSDTFPVKKMAVILKVSRSRYYAWLKTGLSCHDLQDQEYLEIIKDIFEANEGNYGSPRIHDDIKKRGIKCSRKRIARIMAENGLKARIKRKFKATTDSKHDFPIAPNLLERNFIVEEANRCWVSDITYISTYEGWLYLCVILDLFSRMVVGWSMASHLKAELAIDALDMAVAHRNPSEGLILHSDRGVQYASNDFRDKTNSYGITQSMSRKGDCWDNACAESFFSTLKIEEVLKRKYKTKSEARQSIFRYIAVYYNRRRSHSFLDYMSPEEYEKFMYYNKEVA
jgi:putative transposase